MTGSGLVTVYATEAEGPPPGSGLKTNTTAVPSLLMSPARTFTFNCVVLTNVVVRGWPAKYACEADMKPVPLICSVKAGPAAAIDAGESEVIAGAGLDVAESAGTTTS